jgi:hypothetical protein
LLGKFFLKKNIKQCPKTLIKHIFTKILFETRIFNTLKILFGTRIFLNMCENLKRQSYFPERGLHILVLTSIGEHIAMCYVIKIL